MAEGVPAAPLPLKLTLEYDGAGFVGWQMQAQGRSVQSVLQQGIEALCAAPAGSVRVTGAGRTDSGVHARGQVASLLPPRALPLKAWTSGLNALLPEDLACVGAEVAPAGFDARRFSRGKRYRYWVLRSEVRSPLLRHRAWRVREPLDLGAIGEAAGALLGRHDFSAFRASDCPAKTTLRELWRLDVEPQGDGVIEFRVEGSAFLKHMVRNLVGTLVEVGRGQRPRDSLGALLASRDRKRAGVTAPAHGLMLDEVFYLPGLADPRAASPGPAEGAPFEPDDSAD